MTNRRGILAIAIYLALVLIIWAGFTAVPKADIAYEPKTDGVYDLRSFDFVNNIQTIGNMTEWDS
jgi:hypothetical protein